MEIYLWTQSSDYSSSPYKKATVEDVMEALRTFPWVEKFEEYQERLRKEQDCCPPGVGVFRDGACENFAVSIETPETRRLHIDCQRPEPDLPESVPNHLVIDGDLSSVEEALPLLRLFYAEDRTRLIALAKVKLTNQRIWPP